MNRIAWILVFGLLLSAATLPPADAAGTKVKRNPFEYGKRVYKHYPRLNLIIISDTRKAAVIDGKKYVVGDRIGKYKLVGINLDYIEFAHSKGVKKVHVHDRIR